MGFVLFLLLIMLSVSLVLSSVKKGRFAFAAKIFRIVSIVLGISIFTYWFIVRSIDKYLPNSVSLQVTNELPQALDFYIIRVDKKDGKKARVTSHLGNIRPDHFRLDYLIMKNSEEYWLAGYLGKNLVYFSKHFVPNKNIDQTVAVKNYTIENEDSASHAKVEVEKLTFSNMRMAVWATFNLLLIFLNLGLFIRLK